MKRRTGKGRKKGKISKFLVCVKEKKIQEEDANPVLTTQMTSRIFDATNEAVINQQKQSQSYFLQTKTENLGLTNKAV